MDKHDAQVSRLQPASIFHCDVVPLADVIDVDWDAGISALRAKSTKLAVHTLGNQSATFTTNT